MDFTQLITLLETVSSFGDFFQGIGATLSGSADILTGSGDILTGSGNTMTGSALLTEQLQDGFAEGLIDGSIGSGS